MSCFYIGYCVEYYAKLVIYLECLFYCFVTPKREINSHPSFWWNRLIGSPLMRPHMWLAITGLTGAWSSHITFPTLNHYDSSAFCLLALPCSVLMVSCFHWRHLSNLPDITLFLCSVCWYSVSLLLPQSASFWISILALFFCQIWYIGFSVSLSLLIIYLCN